MCMGVRSSWGSERPSMAALFSKSTGRSMAALFGKGMSPAMATFFHSGVPADGMT